MFDKSALELLTRPTLRPKHLEALLDRNRRTIARGIREGSIPSFQIGNTTNIPTSWVLRVLNLAPALPLPEASQRDAGAVAYSDVADRGCPPNTEAQRVI